MYSTQIRLASLLLALGIPVSLLGAESSSAVPAAPPSPLPAVVDLRSQFEEYGFTRSVQGPRPTCSVFTVVGALEFAIAKRQGHCERLSVEFLNWAANRACGDKEDGGFFSDLWKGYAAYGICTRRGMPYQSKFDPAASPSAEAMADAKARLGLGLRLHWIKEWNVKTGLTDDQLLGIKRTLSQGWPVCGGLRWPKREKWVEDVLQMCAADAVRDGHSVLLVGCRDKADEPGGGVFIFRNTSNAGRDGFMPYAYAQAYLNDAAWVDYETQAPPQAATALAPADRPSIR